MKVDNEPINALADSAKPAEPTYSTADDLLSEVAEPRHDLELGRHRIQVAIPVTYFDSFKLDRDTMEWVKLVKSGKVDKELRAYVQRTPEELVAAYTIHRLVAQPRLTQLQALQMLDDGIKVKAIIKSIESLRIQHLQAKAMDTVEAGKDE